MLNNIELFEKCLQNKVASIDYTSKDIRNKIVLPDNENNNELLNANEELIELLDKYKKYNEENDISKNKEIIEKIDGCLKVEGMNYSPFSQYIMIYDVTYYMYLSQLTLQEKEYIIKNYIEDRHNMYKKYGYSNIVFQVLTDSYSHKRKSVMGVEKLKKSCDKYDITRYNPDDSSNKVFYLLPDNGDKKIFKKILQQNNIQFEFAKEHQGKMPDLFIRYNDKFIIVEHKRIKESGGGQDKQITEIIEFIAHGEREVFYISYLDGILFNYLKEPRETNKLYRDKVAIQENLSKNPYNYFVNEYGFNEFMNEITGKANR